jgi:shikimate dehydrogenase
MTDQYAVIGSPIGHSKSPPIHAEFARQTGQDLVYTALEAPRGGFSSVVDMFRANGGKGLNVTMPFKGDAFAYATEFTDRARITQSVNTLTFDGKRVAADTADGAGIVRDIQQNMGFAIRGRRVLLLGAGGAVRSVLLTILEQQPAEVVIANRTVEKALALQRQYAGHGFKVRAGGYPDVRGESFELVISGTSASLTNDLPPLPPEVFAPSSLAYDMVYGKGVTRFLAFARDHGAAQLADGLGMLVEVAAESFYVWRGVRPDTRAVLHTILFNTRSY